MDPRKLRLVALPVVALTLALSACGSSVATAATVGGTKITDEQVAHEAKLFSFVAILNGGVCGQKQDQQPPPPDAPDATPSPTEEETAECNRTALTNLILSQPVKAYAVDNDLSVESKEIDDVIKNVDDQVGKEKVDQQLTDQGLNRDDLRSFVESFLLFQAVQEHVSTAGKSDEELKGLYEEKILDYTTVNASHILVKTKAEADDIYEQVTAPGADEDTFSKLAKKHSTDGSAANGGELGEASASQYVPEFAAAVVALEPGEISEPVQTEHGWHVILLHDKQVQPFEEVKSDLASDPAAFEEWLRSTLEEDGVDVNPSYGRWDSETLTVVAADSTDPSASPEGGDDSGEPPPPPSEPPPAP